MTLPNQKELLAKARRFVLLERNRSVGAPEIAIEWRGEGKWVIVYDGFKQVVGSDLTLSYEPMPSNRDEDFVSKTRFAFDEAWDIAEQFIKKYKLRR